MHAYLGCASKTLDSQPLIVGGVEDHVHLLVNLDKTRSQSEYVKELKRVSSIWAKKREPRLAAFAWQGGRGTFSVIPERLDSMRHYIRNQEEHHKTVSFEEEFLSLSEEHGLEWDARDSFDD
jgi:putative transposase